MNVGLRVSNKGKEATSSNPRDISFSSEHYMHSIGKTGFRNTLAGEEKISHVFGYIPILFSYVEDQNNAGDFMWAGFTALTGADKTRIQWSFASGKKVRYYALYQPI
jgi:hypothetical protein